MTDWYRRASGPWTATEATGLPLTLTQTDQKILGIKFDKEGEGKTNWPDMVGKETKRD